MVLFRYVCAALLLGGCGGGLHAASSAVRGPVGEGARLGAGEPIEFVLALNDRPVAERGELLSGTPWVVRGGEEADRGVLLEAWRRGWRPGPHVFDFETRPSARSAIGVSDVGGVGRDELLRTVADLDLRGLPSWFREGARGLREQVIAFTPGLRRAERVELEASLRAGLASAYQVYWQGVRGRALVEAEEGAAWARAGATLVAFCVEVLEVEDVPAFVARAGAYRGVFDVQPCLATLGWILQVRTARQLTAEQRRRYFGGAFIDDTAHVVRSPGPLRRGERIVRIGATEITSPDQVDFALAALEPRARFWVAAHGEGGRRRHRFRAPTPPREAPTILRFELVAGDDSPAQRDHPLIP